MTGIVVFAYVLLDAETIQGKFFFFSFFVQNMLRSCLPVHTKKVKEKKDETTAFFFHVFH